MAAATTTTTTTTHGSNAPDTAAPFKPYRAMSYSLEVEPFWLEFEAKIPELFSTGDNCRVGIVEYLSSSGCARQQISNMTKSREECHKIRSISSLEELNALLGVRNLVC